jgi:hypothetical protein
MANINISALTEILYAARDIVAAEPTGFIQSVTMNTSKDGISINGVVNSMRAPSPTLNTSTTPSMTIPDGDAQTLAVDTMSIGQTANTNVPLTGEQIKQLENTAGYDEGLANMFANSMRVVRNAVEAHVGDVAYKGASRAFGTAGTTPFATTINNVFDVRKILVDNGAPEDGRSSLVLDTTAGTALRQVPNLYKANEAGSDALLRRGELLNIGGFSIKESAGIVTSTAGTMTGALVNNGAGYAIGATSIVYDTGTPGATGIVAGDVITFAGDTNKYVVKTGPGAAAAGTIVLQEPGLRSAKADNVAITVVAAHANNIAFHQSAIELVVRPPAVPKGGDAAVERFTIQDMKGMVYEVAQYRGYYKALFDITCYYQAKVWNPRYCAVLLG